MFNEELKKAFIENESLTNNSTMSQEKFISYISKYEDSVGKSIFDMDDDEASKMYCAVSGYKNSTSLAQFAIFKRFLEFSRNRDFITKFDLKNMDFSKSSKMKLSMVSSPRHLAIILDHVFDPESDETVDCIYRAYAWLAFIGLPEKYADKVMIDDVDLENVVVNFNNDQYPIYRESFKAFKKCKELKTFNYQHPLYPDHIVVRDRFDSKSLLRGTRSDNTVKKLTPEFAKRIKNSSYAASRGIKISYSRIYLSGVFFRMRESEAMGVPIDFQGFVKDSFEGNSYNSVTFYRKCGCVRRDYADWKDAFGI